MKIKSRLHLHLPLLLSPLQYWACSGRKLVQGVNVLLKVPHRAMYPKEHSIGFEKKGVYSTSSCATTSKMFAKYGPPETAVPVMVQKHTYAFGDGTRDLHVTGVTLVQSLYQCSGSRYDRSGSMTC